MKIQVPTEFLTFNDGFCEIYSVKGNKLDEKLIRLCFGNRVVGFKRHWAARAASTEINRLIQIPLREDVTTENNVVIAGTRYRIEQSQNLNDTNPPVTVLTLRKVGVVT
ncbi:hypothetical protein FL966_01775 [Caproiciproducens galactitolivorans]|uniref:Phage head-tail joining protein n=1 Tax=Caproiciproducens galactitolivorans TaxID=642589 RepID=A0A4Z0YEB5_9FIRM|nr:hypothetical protein [Caproiciproducens galactitolivorans]QEY33872.1 hypothetical protein FL966_01775 [Caproiciproducens galactitolivorans]TGJ75382.1 hypothetical protein CAGA_24810 [Caproiciproducens galactitolivorans]